MAKARNSLASFLGKMGGRLLSFLSGCEERRILPGFAGWAKLSTLGLIVTLVGWLAAKSVPYPGPTCYAAPPIPNVLVTDVSISPNPTEGADSVTIRAQATTRNNPDVRRPYISSAYMNIFGDTIPIPLKAVDGKFSDSLEIVEGRLYVNAMEPESTWVELLVNTSSGIRETYWIPIVISEPASSEASE